ncbi:hypothetical protein KC19_12G044900 [Ceratodon purpureus]|uniref:30S ribosomal protein S21, chloroplastic n=1 Tax=Ceratodon purpureus TaxID=3225 RepID=A0A8T0G480_CERPU|nr:hypothetical protein KC19_12G044900 [Ceratodon purpureus]
MAMSSAVFTPVPISSSLRCSASAEPASNGASSSSTNSVRLPQSSVQPLALNNGEASSSASVMSVLHPGMEFVNVMYFKGSYNTQVFVGEDEPADSVVRRFRKAVMQAGVIPECRRRRFHETPQDIVKRKQQNARRKKLSNRRFTGPRPEGGFGDKTETKSAADDDDDFWGYAEEGADAHL